MNRNIQRLFSFFMVLAWRGYVGVAPIQTVATASPAAVVDSAYARMSYKLLVGGAEQSKPGANSRIDLLVLDLW